MPGIDENELQEKIDPEQIDDVKLYNVLLERFDETELELLCLEIEIGRDVIVSDNKRKSVLFIIKYCRRHAGIGPLVAYIRQERSHISLTDLLKPRHLPNRNSSSNLEFVNRVYELDLVCTPVTPRFKLIDGAAGYGKTHLLNKILETYQTDEHARWRAAYINLRQDPDMCSQDLQRAGECIARAIVTSLAGAQGIEALKQGSEPDIGTELVQFLDKQLHDRDNGILLLWDCIEVLPIATSRWLKDLMYQLDEGLQNANKTLIVVFSGRYVDSWARGEQYPFTTISLSPFNFAVVRQMIVRRATAGRSSLPQASYLDEFTWRVLDISGGHPQGICNVLDQVAHGSILQTSLDRVFLRKSFTFDGRTGTLFEVCIVPIIEQLTNGLHPDLQSVFHRLSPVRRYSPAILEHFIAKGLIDVPPQLSSGWALMAAMEQTHLIRPPVMGDPMYSDQIVRRMLSVQLRLTDPKEFVRINAAAQALFDGWARRRRQIDAHVWCTAVIENLYHTLQSDVNVAVPGNPLNCLLKSVGNHLEYAKDPDDIYQLRDALKRDEEVLDMLKRRTGIATIQLLTEMMELKIQQMIQQMVQTKARPKTKAKTKAKTQAMTSVSAQV